MAKHLFSKKDARDTLQNKLCEMRLRGFTEAEFNRSAIIFRDNGETVYTTIGELLDRLVS